MFSDTQNEVYDSAKEFVFKQLNKLLSIASDQDKKIALFFVLSVSLLKNKQSTINIAKQAYPDDYY
tara:strand:+ start:2729 stop:2926 length:198 start_codon:yes stop_codon:yes gene_type:complete